MLIVDATAGVAEPVEIDEEYIPSLTQGVSGFCNGDWLAPKFAST